MGVSAAGAPNQDECFLPHPAGRSLCSRHATSPQGGEMRVIGRQFNTRLASGLSSEKVGTSISKRSPLSLTI
jgi:hypothetical protein